LVIGGGTLAIALGAAAATTVAGAVAGGVAGFLIDQGVPEASVADYSRILGTGGALITVFPSDEKVETATIEGVLTKYDGRVSLYAANAMAAVY
jgi:uncharacterized protein YcfJ